MSEPKMAELRVVTLAAMALAGTVAAVCQIVVSFIAAILMAFGQPGRSRGLASSRAAPPGRLAVTSG